jgi:hypothetical protein
VNPFAWSVDKDINKYEEFINVEALKYRSGIANKFKKPHEGIRAVAGGVLIRILINMKSLNRCSHYSILAE